MTETALVDRPAGDLRGAADLMALLDRVERRVVVDRWRVGELDVWPLVRVRLGHRLARALDARPERRIDVGLRAVVERATEAALGLTRLAHRRSAPDSHLAAAGGTRRAVICSDGVSFVDTSAGPRDRHADPLRTLLADRGVRTTLLVPGHRAPTGLTGDVQPVQARLDLAMAATRMRLPPTVDLPGYADVLDELRSAGVDRHLPTPTTIGYAGAAVEAMASTFERELHRSQADLALVVEWYALHNMAFVLACHRAGIPVTDIQHGVQGPLHYAYADWGRLPAAGSALMPDTFWVWDDLAATTIAAWSPRGAAGAIVGGNLEQREWLEGSAPGAAATLRLVDDLLAGHRAEALVLVAAAGEDADADLDAVLDAAAAGPDAWLWAIRCHPSDPNPARWIARAETRGLTNVEVHESTALPLFALLSRASAVVTRHSSVVLDGLAFGVRSVLTGTQGRELFAAEIDRGAAVMAGPTPADVVTAVMSILGPGPTAVMPADADAALDALIGTIR